jgi:hypothetical protein
MYQSQDYKKRGGGGLIKESCDTGSDDAIDDETLIEIS